MSSSFWRFNHKKVLKDQIFGNDQRFTRNLDYLRNSKNIKKKNYILFGKSWDTPSLRLKSDLDLKLLWYKVIREKNKLSSEFDFEYKKKDHGIENLIFTKAINNLKVTLNRIKGVLNERSTHRNNCMTFLEFYDYKKSQYENLYFSKFPADKNVKDPMFSASELEKMNIVKDYIKTFKEINQIDELYNESLDWNQIHMIHGNFNVFDPFNLLSIFHNQSNYSLFNKVMIAKKLLIENLRTTQVIMREIDHTIKIVSENDKTSTLIEESESEKFKNLSENLRVRILNLTEDKKVLDQTSTKFLESGIEYFKDEDKLIVKREDFNSQDKLEEYIKKYEKYILKIRNENTTTLESLEHFVTIYEKYINNLKNTLIFESAKKRLSEKEYIIRLKRNSKYRSLDKKINFFKTKLDNNILLVDFEIEKEKIYLNVFKDKLNELKNSVLEEEKNISQIGVFLNEKVNSKIIDDGFKKMLFVEIPNVINFENKLKNKLIKLIEKTESKSDLYEYKKGISVLSKNDTNIIKDLTYKNKPSEIISNYVENYERFNLRQKRIIFNKIQKDRAQLAKDISIKEMALISSQASKINSELEGSVDVVKSLEEMIAKAESMNNIDLVEVLKEKYEFEKNKIANKSNSSSEILKQKYLELMKKSASNYLTERRDESVFDKLKNSMKNNDEVVKTKLKKSKML